LTPRLFRTRNLNPIRKTFNPYYRVSQIVTILNLQTQSQRAFQRFLQNLWYFKFEAQEQYRAWRIDGSSNHNSFARQGEVKFKKWKNCFTLPYNKWISPFFFIEKSGLSSVTHVTIFELKINAFFFFNLSSDKCSVAKAHTVFFLLFPRYNNLRCQSSKCLSFNFWNKNLFLVHFWVHFLWPTLYYGDYFCAFLQCPIKVKYGFIRLWTQTCVIFI